MGNICSNSSSPPFESEDVDSSTPPSEDEDASIDVEAPGTRTQASRRPDVETKTYRTAPAVQALRADVETRMYRAVPGCGAQAAQAMKVLLENGAKQLGIAVRKHSRPAGLDFAHSLVVTAIVAGGLGEEWNKKHPE
eukprot:CAMPEP_0195087148 /NCGR_PEP_ID=MMETSP0448-20130528/27076_1 /TAXON_ID=66468 /ORGANISM="Heterocapsa triquestra, Strain CCMP 448" /LENGTH=136 /DNA_ID=CAMNT_0040120687 /DNA_START=69 /DNA_END=476 /DNA_ORIENTATION=+